MKNHQESPPTPTGLSEAILEGKMHHSLGQIWRQEFKFFQVVATERYRKNNIANLQTDDGLMVEDHTGKEALLFQACTERLGTSNPTQMQFDLRSLIRPTENLDHLILPFTHEEIDSVVKEMPGDRAPGPDGLVGCSSKLAGLSSRKLSSAYAFNSMMAHSIFKALMMD